MSNTAQNIKQDVQEVKTFFSGGPKTTGREPFEDGTPLVPVAGATHSSSEPHIVPGHSLTGGSTTTHSHGLSGLTGEHSTGTDHSHSHSHSHTTGSGLSSSDSDGTRGTGQHEGSGLSGSGNHSTGTGHTGTGIAAAAAGAATGHGHHEHPATGATRTSGTGINTGGSHSDRVGALDQDSSNYERTGTGGPVTGGAAGTDRFDTGKLRDNLPGSGTGREGGSVHTHGTGGMTDTNAFDAHPQVERDDKKKGGLAGVFGTSDKDFTDRDRLGGKDGAYGDSDGHFKGNTSGPTGNTALTGREGTEHNNPISQAVSGSDHKTADPSGGIHARQAETLHHEPSRGTGTGAGVGTGVGSGLTGSHTTGATSQHGVTHPGPDASTHGTDLHGSTGTGVHDDHARGTHTAGVDEHGTEHKSFMQKVKDAIS